MILSTFTDHSTLFKNDVLEKIFKFLKSSDAEEKFLAAKIVLKFLETPKRYCIVGTKLVALIECALMCTNDSAPGNVLTGIRILAILFDIEEDISETVFKLGGLAAVIQHCTSKDLGVLEACAQAILMVILNGEKNCENLLMKTDSMTQWFVPLINIYSNQTIKLYAYLSLIYLRTIRGANNEIFRNGFIDDFVQWISDEDTYKRLLCDYSMKSIDKKRLIKQILPLLTESCKVSQAFGSFWIYCEVKKTTKDLTNQTVYFKAEKVVRALQRIVLMSVEVAQKFAALVLEVIGKKVPSLVRLDVIQWTVIERNEWLDVIGFSHFKENFGETKVSDLFHVTCSELKEKFFIYDNSKRKEFLEEIHILMRMKQKTMTKTASRIAKASSFIIKNKNNVGSKSNNVMANGTSRSMEASPIEEIVFLPLKPTKIKKKTDVFISYRRSNGSDLASLLKTRLTFAGFKIFFDVDSLRSGHFGNSLIKNVRKARNFILLLTPNALDRCLIDRENKDWVKIEILEALSSNCNIVPVVKDFDMKVFEDEKFPDDMKPLINYNQVLWHHDSQNGSFEKILE
jgi:hypothetical protein